MKDAIATLFDRAAAELACERCYNRGSVMTKLGQDECPACQGAGRNAATIGLLLILAAPRSIELSLRGKELKP